VGLISTFRLIGGAVATAIYTSIQTTKYNSVLPGKVTAAAAASKFSGSVPALLKAAAKNTAVAYKAVPGISNGTIAATQAAVRQANVEAYQLVYLVAIAFGCVAITCALTTKGVQDKDRSREVSAKLENERPGGKVIDYHTH
jgi:hypothetical protein